MGDEAWGPSSRGSDGAGQDPAVGTAGGARRDQVDAQLRDLTRRGGYETAAVCTIGGGGPSVVAYSVEGGPAVRSEVALRRGVVQRASALESATTMAWAELTERCPELRDCWSPMRERQVGLVPVRDADGVVGVLAVGLGERTAFREGEADRLRAGVAGVAGVLRRMRERPARVPAPRRRSRTASRALPPDSTAPRAARGFVLERLEAWGVPVERVDDARLAVSELVTNAFLHGGGSSTVDLRLAPGRLEVRVRQESPRLLDTPREPWHLEPDEMAQHGRGLLIVDALSSAWGVEPDGAGALAWFTLDLP